MNKDRIPNCSPDMVPVVEEGRYSKEEVQRVHAVEVPKYILDRVNYMNKYQEKALERR